MKLYSMDSFTVYKGCGNPAGVVICDKPLTDEIMLSVAAYLNFSETAFVSKACDACIDLRYFTPVCEVDLCGHATVGAFALLRQLNIITDGKYRAVTKAGVLCVEVSGETVWMDMALPIYHRELNEDEARRLFESFNLDSSRLLGKLKPAIVSTGLKDIIMPVTDFDALLSAKMDTKAITALSRELGCVGVHMFCLAEDCTAKCSDFAPLYGIDEECATGTASGALTYYLYKNGMIEGDCDCLFVQGEHMQRPCKIKSKLINGIQVKVGGTAVLRNVVDYEVKL